VIRKSDAACGEIIGETAQKFVDSARVDLLEDVGLSEEAQGQRNGVRS
jgi:hypothetical protein